MGARRKAGNAPAITINLNWPDEIWVYDILVKLQPKQWDLLVLMASRPGKYCSYDEIYETLWPKGITEDKYTVGDNQISYQKTMLLKQLVKARRESVNWLVTIPKRGFVLDLDESQVLILRDTPAHRGERPQHNRKT